MKNALSALLIIGCGLFGPLSASAKPILDRDVLSFLSSSPRRGGETLQVVILYRNRQSAKIQQQPDFEKQAIREAKTNEERVFGKLSRGLQISRESFWLFNGSIAGLTRDELKTLAGEDDVSAIQFAKKKIRIKPEPALSAGNFTYGLRNLKIPEVRAKYPSLTGEGVRVGILDTGIDPEHPDLKGRLKTYKDFSSENSPIPSDGFKHGTHVAGTISGGALSGQSIGVAPKVQLIVGKIFNGNGDSERADILRAMQWIADPDSDPSTNDAPQVINSSWGDDDPYADRNPEDEPFCRVTDSWVKLGIIPVFAAGNSGSRPGSTGLPGGCPSAFAVGATNVNDQSPWFSSAGPAMWKSIQIVKPEIAAPGMDVYSTIPNGQYQLMSGTSMSTPHVTGAFALILQAKPGISVEAAEQALISGAKDLGDPGKDNDFGWGRPDLLNSIDRLMQ